MTEAQPDSAEYEAIVAEKSHFLTSGLMAREIEKYAAIKANSRKAAIQLVFALERAGKLATFEKRASLAKIICYVGLDNKENTKPVIITW